MDVQSSGAAIRTIALGVMCAASLGACLDPLVSDDLPPRGLVWPADKEVPSFAATAEGRAQIADNDGVEEGLIRLRSGFSGGAPVRFWDFGEASPNAIPLYLPVKLAEGGAFATPLGDYNPIGHVPIFDAIPGDAAYSPWWTVLLLPVTAQWTGGTLASFAAVDEAYSLGLVGEPIELPFAINCPVVLPDARLEQTGAQQPRSPSPAYYRGTLVHYFDFGTFPIENEVVVVHDVFQLRREGGEPLSEVFRGVDLTGDGDAVDTNDIFAKKPGDTTYTGLVRPTEVVIAADSESIDTSGDDTSAEFMAVEDLFTIGDGTFIPRTGPVRAVYPGSKILNWPLANPPPEAR